MYRIRFWGILQQNHNIKEPYGEVLVIIQALLSNLSHQPQTRTRRKTAKPPKIEMGVSENRGTSFWGPYNKDPAI